MYDDEELHVWLKRRHDVAPIRQARARERRHQAEVVQRVAVVDDLVSDADAAGHREAPWQPNALREVDAVVDILRTRFDLDHILGQAKKLRVDIVVTAQLIASASGQARIGGRHDAVWTVACRRHVLVLRGADVAVRAAGIRHADRHAWPQLVLERPGDLPVVAPRRECRRAVGRDDVGETEGGHVQRTELAGLGDEVSVGIVPGPAWR